MAHNIGCRLNCSDPTCRACAEAIDGVWNYAGNQLDVREARLNAELDAVHVYRTALARYGDDTYEDGAVIQFEKVLNRKDPNATCYLYAALKSSNGYWYTTGPVNGRGNSPWTWDQLTQWMATGWPVTEIWVFTQMERVTP